MLDKRLEDAPCGFISINHEGFIQEVNHTFLNWMGFVKGELIGKHFETFLPMGNKLIFHSYFYPNIHLHHYVEELIINLKNFDGTAIPYLINAKHYELDGEEFIDCILVQMKKRVDYELELRTTKRKMEEAYAEKKKALAQLEQIYKDIEQKQAELIAMNSGLMELSYTDKLTNIKNRRFFQEKLEEIIQQQIPFSIFLIDIDYFKKVNDTYGHQVGDVVLIKLAAILQQEARPQDIVARFGGEEFIMLLPNIEGLEAKHIAIILNKTVEQAEWSVIEGLTISIGIATFRAEDTDSSVILNADQALYASKKNGRNRATHFEDMHL